MREAKLVDGSDPPCAVVIAAVDDLQIAVIVIDQQRVLRYANTQAHHLLAEAPELLTSDRSQRRTTRVFASGTSTAYPVGHMPMVRALEGVESFVDDLEVHGPQAVVQLEAWARPITSDTGEVKFAVGTFADVTERKQLQAELSLLRQVGDSVAAASSLEDALADSLRGICEVTGWPFGQAWIPNETGSHLQCSRAWYAVDAALARFREESQQVSLAPDTGLPGRAWSTRRPQWSNDLTSDHGFRRAHGAAEVGLAAGVAVPVLLHGKAVAVIEFFLPERRERDEHFLTLVATVAGQLSLMMRGKEATDALTASEAEFRAVAETAADAIISASSDGHITFFNRAAEALFRRALGTSLGQPLTVLIPERLRPAHTEGFNRFIQTRESRLQGHPVEVTALRGDGTEFCAQLSLAHWYSGGEVFSTAIVRDMSERVQAEAAVRSALQAEQQVTHRLQELDAMKSTLLHTVSHDLRSPIAAILALTQILRNKVSDGSSDETQLRLLASIEVTAQKMEHLLRDLISADRMDSVEPKRAPCDLGALVLRAVDETRIRARHPVETRVAPVDVRVDASQVERIVENLLRNVMEHVPDGVPVWVSVDPTVGGATISVKDAGPGIPADLQQHVFEIFQRGPEAAPGGSGIGLSLVSRFAELHGGSAWVEDRSGGGAAFRVFLPDKREG